MDALFILEMWHNFIILTKSLSYLFNQGDFHEPSIPLKNENRISKFTGVLQNVHHKIMARPFIKTSGLG